MKVRFIVVVNDLSEDEQKNFVNFLEKNNIDKWKWTAHFWLLVDHSGNLTATGLRDLFIETAPKKYNFVIQFDDLENVHIAAYAEHDPDRRLSNWLNEHWYDH